MKKAQMKIQQMSFMLLAVVLFFVIVGLFYLSIRVQGVKESAEDLQKQAAVSIAGELANSPEFTCGKPFLCVDADKLIVMLNRPEYAGFWPVDGIKVVRVFPLKNMTECNKNNYPECDVFSVVDTGKSNIVYFSTFVSVCRKDEKNGFAYDKCELGRLMIGSAKNE